MPIGLGTLAQVLGSFLARTVQCARDNEGAYLPSQAAEGLWQQTTSLAMALQQDVVSPGVPRPIASDGAVEGCELRPTANGQPVFECLRDIAFMIPYNPDGSWVRSIPERTIGRLGALRDELEQLVEHVRRATPNGEPEDLGGATRLCWRLEALRARAQELQAAVVRALSDSRAAQARGEEADQHVILPLTSARWAFRCALDDADDAVAPFLLLIDPENTVFRNRISVDLRSDLSVLRSWDLVARRAIEPRWWEGGDAAEFPQAALERVEKTAEQIGAGGWRPPTPLTELRGQDDPPQKSTGSGGEMGRSGRWFSVTWYGEHTKQGLYADLLRMAAIRGLIRGDMVGKRWQYELGSVCQYYSQYRDQLEAAARHEPRRTSTNQGEHLSS